MAKVSPILELDIVDTLKVCIANTKYKRRINNFLYICSFFSGPVQTMASVSILMHYGWLRFSSLRFCSLLSSHIVLAFNNKCLLLFLHAI